MLNKENKTHHLGFIFIVIITGLLRTGLLHGAIEEGLVGYWKFNRSSNGSIIDNSSSANHGTLINASQFVSGKIDEALHFTAGSASPYTAQYVKLSKPFGSSQWTISLWVKPVMPIPGPGAPYYGLYTIFSADEGRLVLDLQANGIYIYTTQITAFNFSSASNSWHHVVISYDGKAVSALVDNSAYGKKEMPNPLAKSLVRYIGSGGSATHNFNGAIDEVRLYNRVLDAKELATLYDPSFANDNEAPRITQTWPTQALQSWEHYSHIEINTNEDAQCRCSDNSSDDYYSMPNQMGSYTQKHTLSVMGLEAGKDYTYYARCRDKAGNFSSAYRTNVSLLPDLKSPQITEIDHTLIDSTTVDVAWTTDEPTDSLLEYGTTASYGSKSWYDPSYAIPHAVMLTNLSPATTYHYRVISKDKVGNQVISTDKTFTTWPARSPKEFYVAKNGSDANPGTVDLPFASLEKARDTLRNFKPALLLGSPEWGEGIQNKGIKFDGTDDFIKLGYAIGSNQWSLSMWIKPDLPVRSAAPYYGLYTLLTGDSGRQVLDIQGSGIYLYTTKIANYNFNANPGWHHLNINYDGTRLIGYVDGLKMGELVAPNPLAVPQKRFLGGNGGGSTHAFIGNMDEIRFYERALSENEIMLLRQNNASGVTGKMQIYLAFNEGSGDKVQNEAYPLLPGGATVWIRGGVYERETVFALTVEDGGSETAPIIYAAYPGEEVRISGGRVLSQVSSVADRSILNRLSQEARNHAKQINLKALGIADYGQLVPRGRLNKTAPAVNTLEPYCNGKSMRLARWPNAGYVNIKEVLETSPNGVFTYDSDRPAQWASSEDIWVHGAFHTNWAHNHEKILSIDTNRKIITTDKYSVYGYAPGGWFYFENVLEELDSPGEWYLDRNNGILYFWPPENGEISVSMLNLLLSSSAPYAQFRNIIFEQSRRYLVWVERNAHHTTFLGCTFRGAGTTGGAIYDSPYSGIFGCKIYDTGDYGFTLSASSDLTLRSTRNFAENCQVYNYGRWLCDTVGIALSGAGGRVRHNRISDSPYIGITYGGNNHIVDFNHISDIMLENTDGGATYTGGSWISRGSIVRYNYVHDLFGLNNQWSNGIYLDDILDGHTVYGNVLHQVNGATALIGGGRDHTIENNIFVECKRSMHVDDRAFGQWSIRFPNTVIDATNTSPSIITLERNINTRITTTLNYKIKVEGAEGNTAVNGTWDFEIMAPNQLRLLGSSGNGVYTGGGSAMVDNSPYYAQMAKIDVPDSAYYRYYPLLKRRLTEQDPKLPLGNQVLRNIFFQNGVGNWDGIYPTIKPYIYLKDNLINTDPKFFDFQNKNFQLREDSPAYALGFKKIPIEKIGLLDLYLKADLSKDGRVSAYDSSLAMKIAQRGNPAPDELKRGDVNGDGKIDAADAVLIGKKAVGLIEK